MEPPNPAPVTSSPRRIRVRRRARRRRPWWRRGPLRFIGPAVAVTGLLLVLDGAWAASSALGDLSEARAHLATGENDLVAGDFEEAGRRFEEAREAARRAEGFTIHPSAALAGVVPGLSDEIDAIQTMARATELAGDTGTVLVRTAREAGWREGALPGATTAGRFDLSVVETAGPGLTEAAATLDRALSLLDGLNEEALLGPVENAARSARSVLAERSRALGSAATLAEILPELLGGDGTRRYLLALQNLSAPRGTGGFLGVYGTLEAEDGSLSLETLTHSSGFGAVEPIGAPEDVTARYGRFGGTRYLIAANYSPDFPTSARVMLDLYRARTGEELDGVISADSRALAHLLGVLGPVETSAWDEPITAQNVDTILNQETFLLPQPESNRTQEQLGRDIWSSLLSRALPRTGLGAALDRAAREHHFQVYAVEAEEQAALDRLGVTGRYELGANPLAVVWQDATNNRAGYFAQKHISHRVVLRRDGSAGFRTDVTLRNEAPDGPPSILLGQGTTGDPVGYNAAYLNAYLPEGAERVDARIEDGLALGLVEREFEHPVVMELLEAPAGGIARLELSYEVPEATRSTPNGRLLPIDILPQPALRPDTISIEVLLPPGTEVLDASSGWSILDGRARFEGVPVIPTRLWLAYAQA